MQTDTRRQLADVYGRLGRHDEEQDMLARLNESVGNIREAASSKLEAAQNAQVKILERLGKARAQNLIAWQTAIRQVYPSLLTAGRCC